MAPRSLVVGVDPSTGAPVRVPLTTLLKHRMTLGATGAGKTGALISDTVQLLRDHPGIGVVVLDMKGEAVTELREHFLPALLPRLPHLDVRAIISVEPFGPYGIAFDPLHPIPGLAQEVQAHLVVRLIDGLVDGGLGPRMAGILTWLVRAAMQTRGTLLTVVRLLTDETFPTRLAQRVADPEVGHYLVATLPRESRASHEALRSRMEHLVLLPVVRAMLCSGSALPARAILAAPLALITLGGAPQGFLAVARFVGSLLFEVLAAGIMAREVGPETRPVVLAIDEWQQLVRGYSPEAFEDLLSLARFKKIALWLYNQSASQIGAVSQALLTSAITNVATRTLFQPQPGDDLRGIERLLPLTGARIDPMRPDRVLSPEAERRAVVQDLLALPPRHAIFVDRIAGHALPIRTPDLPYEAVRRCAEQIPADLHEQLRRGRYGVPVEELLRRSRLDPAADIGSAVVPASPPPHARSSRRSGQTDRGRLVLP